jgi:hypothetical protein
MKRLIRNSYVGEILSQTTQAGHRPARSWRMVGAKGTP